jgi:fluoride exporter
LPPPNDQPHSLPADPDADMDAEPGAEAPGGDPSRRRRGGGGQLAIVVAVGIGGVFGAVARYAVSLALPTTTGSFPWSTFVVNVSGSVALGLLLVMVAERLSRGRMTRAVVGTGVIGAYTTFSTFEIDAVNLIRAGRPATAAVYVIASVVAGLAGCWLGIAGARTLWPLRPRLGERS